jgi:zinc and cadmium transporter
MRDLVQAPHTMTILAALLFFLLPMLSGGMVRMIKPDGRWLLLLLSFSGAFLLGVVFLHMLPELYEEEGAELGVWVLSGFLLQVVLEYFSRGIEHGHVHVPHGKAMPWLTLFSLCVHAFVEGIPFADPKVSGNIPFLGGVILHKMPMAIALASVLQRSGTGRSRSWIVLLIFAVSAPAGILTGLLVSDGLGIGFLHRMLGLAIGMLLHIGTTIIFESAPEHRLDRARFAAVIVGAVLAAFSMH